jgi:hypothetical protein
MSAGGTSVASCPCTALAMTRNGEVWVKTTVSHADPAAHWRQRLTDGLAHDLGLSQCADRTRWHGLTRAGA